MIETLEIGAGTEKLFAVTGQNQGVIVAFAIKLLHQLLQVAQAFRCPGIGRRIIEGNDGGVAAPLQL